MGYVRDCLGEIRSQLDTDRGFGTRGEGMAESYSSKLQLWEGWMPALVKGPAPPTAGDRLLAAPHYQMELADRLYAREALHANGRSLQGAEPFTLQWFLDIEDARHSRYGSWIPRLLEFVKHGGETLLGLGNGLGTDWVQYARHGAQVIACCSSAEQLALIQRNFALRSLQGVFLHADPASIPLEPASIDVVCVADLLEDVASPSSVIEEIYRLLKPGGKVLAVTPARFNLDFWRRSCLPWHALLRRRSASHPRSLSFSARALRQLFGRFVESRVYKRQLRRAEVPHLWRWLPHPLLERMLGRMLIIKAFKPLSAAIPVALAA
jgi:SAM-dependent methyltransferase